MPGVDWIPGVSQIKAIAQSLTGDKEGARETCKNFLQECPGVSQVTSVVQVIEGDFEGAKETQKRCLGTLNNVANGLPVVGHIKGVAHHIAGDHEGGNKALNAANRTTVVAGTGLVVGIATGGLVAGPAGVIAGTWYDLLTTKITGKQQGSIATLRNAIENPSAATIIDAIAVPIRDGLAGYSGGQIGEQLSSSTVQPQTVGAQAKLSSLEAARAAKLDILNGELGKVAATGEGMTAGQVVAIGKEIKSLTSEISLIKDGTPKFWTDLKPPKPQTNSVTAPILGSYDKDNKTIKKVPINITGIDRIVVVGTTASVIGTTASFPPQEFIEKNTQSNKNVKIVKPWDNSIIKYYSYQQQQSIFKLCNRKKSEEEIQTVFAPIILEEDDAIYYDSYVKNSWSDLQFNYQARQTTLKFFSNQKPEKELNSKFVPIFSKKNLDKVRDLNNNNNNRKPYDPKKDVEERELNRMLNSSWLHLNLPEDLLSYSVHGIR